MSILLALPTLGQRPAWLEASIESILCQKADARVVLVSPASSVASLAAQKYGLEHKVCASLGLSRAVNEVWRDAGEEFVTWLGDDDLLAPDSLAVTLSALSRQPDKGFVYGRSRYITGEGTTLFVSRPTRYAAAYLRYGKNFVPQPGSLIRRSCAERVGLLDETLKNAMDQDLFTRIHRLHGSVYINKEISAYRLHDTNITITKGDRDESAIVRARYSGTTVQLLTNRRFNLLFSHALYSIQKRIPSAAGADPAYYKAPKEVKLETR